MAETSFIVEEATAAEPIQQIEQLLNGLAGIERVLIDTEDGKVKVAFDREKISEKKLMALLKAHKFSVIKSSEHIQ